jgi:hypothetical protein
VPHACFQSARRGGLITQVVFAALPFGCPRPLAAAPFAPPRDARHAPTRSPRVSHRIHPAIPANPLIYLSMCDIPALDVIPSVTRGERVAVGV